MERVNSENKSKLPSELTDEELLQAAEFGVVLEKEHQFSNDIISFIRVFGLKPGNKKIKLEFLYLTYKKWSKEPQKITEFCRIFSGYFRSNARNVFLNCDNFKLNEVFDRLKPKRANIRTNKSHTLHYNAF